MVINNAINLLSDNNHIRHRVTDMYRDIVRQVDPRGDVLDYLIGKRIVTEEVAQQVRNKDSRQERCRAMLHELLNSGEPRVFVELREALKHDYSFIVDRIDDITTGDFSFSYEK